MLHILADVFMQQGPTSSGLAARVAGSPCLAFEYAETACCPGGWWQMLWNMPQEHAPADVTQTAWRPSMEAGKAGKAVCSRKGKSSKGGSSRSRSRSSGIGPDIL
ncbi:hypothetical protein TWF788_006195 [Orbilia oligospora]|uniref:Uncharacterized protein n=1 Tax=Orbilia oligospora TaxID=2813651 RepID=A0A7C8U3F4_ORBOL|nr:hypothetical protein TWF788_006195 [Orbilia oligospora]